MIRTAIAVIVLAAAVLTGTGCAEPRTYIGCTVLDKDRAGNRGGQSDMRIYTDRCDVFTIEDTWDRKDSASLYGKIQIGHRYTIRATGHRNPGMSMFPNIIDAVEEKT